jgi:hypothetical protein
LTRNEDDLYVPEAVPYDAELCPGPAVADGACCPHCQRLIDKYISIDGHLSVSNCIKVLEEAWVAKDKCELLSTWLSDLVYCVGVSCELILMKKELWQENAEHIVAARGTKRRMRLDSDMAGATLKELVQSKRFRSGRQAARAGNVDMDTRSISDADEIKMRRYWAAMLGLWTACKQLSMATDESSVGGEATMISCVWDHVRKLGGWLLVQACSRSISCNRFAMSRGGHDIHDSDLACLRKGLFSGFVAHPVS